MIEIYESPLLGLDRHRRAYQLLDDVRLCKFEATSMDERRLRFRAADCEAITDKLGLVDWHGLFSRKRFDLCVYSAFTGVRLRGDFTALRSTYQQKYVWACLYDDDRIGIEEEIKTDPKSFFRANQDRVTRNL
jgi:hypothetical protein